MHVELPYGSRAVTLRIPDEIEVERCERKVVEAAADPMGLVAAAIDQPTTGPSLSEAARGVRSVAVVVPDRSEPAAVQQTILPVIARLAREGLTPERIHVVLARGLHPTTPRGEVGTLLGAEVMQGLRTIQSAPETPELNTLLLEDEQIGPIHVHRVVAQADLIVLTGVVSPHNLAGFSGGPKSLVPGVADRDTVMRAHRLTLDTLVAPDGSVNPIAGHTNLNRDNSYHRALLRIVRATDACFGVNTVMATDGGLATAFAGEVGHAQEAAIESWQSLYGLPQAEPADLVLVGGPTPRDTNLLQAHKVLMAALPYAKPGAPIVWSARAPEGPGHREFLPWFEVKPLSRHLMALRENFHPYGLTAYCMRWAAKRNPIMAVSEVSRDILRPMGFHPFGDAQAALDHALSKHTVKRALVLPVIP